MVPFWTKLLSHFQLNPKFHDTRKDLDAVTSLCVTCKEVRLSDLSRGLHSSKTIIEGHLDLSILTAGILAFLRQFARIKVDNSVESSVQTLLFSH